MLLKDFMGEALADWERDLSAPWRGFLDPVALDFEAMGGTLRIDDPSLLRPQRKRPGHRAGDPHIFRAFNHIEPERVRVLVIGQDPYPSPGQATGRAFEDGLFDAWDGSVSASIKRLRRLAIALRRPEERILPAKAKPWKKLHGLMTAQPDELGEPVSVWFDRLEQQGVMFVNAALTLTKSGRPLSREQRAHLRLWRPFIRRLVERLAERPDREIVFLLLGDPARQAFVDARVTLRRRSARSNLPVVDRVEHWHPTYAKFLATNPFDTVNEKLSGGPIHW